MDDIYNVAHTGRPDSYDVERMKHTGCVHWDKKIVEYVLDDFEKFREEHPLLFENKTENHIEGIKWGYVAEALIEHLNDATVHLPTDGPDVGYDYLRVKDDYIEKVDVKCKKVRYGNDKSVLSRYLYEPTRYWWSVGLYHDLRADVYQFVVINPERKEVIIIGELSADYIKENCRIVRKGEPINDYGIISTSDCAIVTWNDIYHALAQKDLQELRTRKELQAEKVAQKKKG